MLVMSRTTKVVLPFSRTISRLVPSSLHAPALFCAIGLFGPAAGLDELARPCPGRQEVARTMAIATAGRSFARFIDAIDSNPAEMDWVTRRPPHGRPSTWPLKERAGAPCNRLYLLLVSKWRSSARASRAWWRPRPR